VACIHLACKSEEAFIKPVQLAEHTQIKLETLVKMEVPLLQGLKFHLRVYHPFRPLAGFLIKLRELDSEVEVGEFEKEATNFIHHSLFTDACLLHSPSQIALAALSKAAAKKKI